LTALLPGAYAQGGVPLWTNLYNPLLIDSFATAAVVDSDGNVFVTGYSGGHFAPFYYQYVTIKYSNTGASLWTNSYFGQALADCVANAITLDSNGDVVVTGYAGNNYTYPFNHDYVTIKYSSVGVPLWTNRYDGPASLDDQAYAIGVDGNGNVFVTGASAGTNGYSDYTTIAYSREGTALWTNRYNQPGNFVSVSKALTVDNNGNVFVTGSSNSGIPLWTNLYSAGYGGDVASALGVDSNGNVFVTGPSATSSSPPYNRDYATLKYSNAGVPLWTNRYHGLGNDEDIATALAVDRNGNVIVTGDASHGTSIDYATVMYSNTGTPLWTNLYNGHGYDFFGFNRDHAFALAVDCGGNVFVTGSSYTSDGTYDYAVVAYSSGGAALWTNCYNGPANTNDYGRAIAVDGRGNVFVTGYSYDADGYSGYATIKYSSSIPPVHLAIVPDGSGGYFVRFSGTPGCAYRLERAPGLTGPWSAGAPIIAPASGLVEFRDLFPPPGQAFYRTVFEGLP